jgi:hypothetical protein
LVVDGDGDVNAESRPTTLFGEAVHVAVAINDRVTTTGST